MHSIVVMFMFGRWLLIPQRFSSCSNQLKNDAPLSSKEVRRLFIGYFVEQNHVFVPSSSSVPLNDPTLPFTNAGMNQVNLLGQDFVYS